MIDHERLLKEMGRKNEAHTALMIRYSTYRDFDDCYQAGVKDYCSNELESALDNLTAACALARRTEAGSRFSALTFLALVQLSLGQTEQAASSLQEAKPLYDKNIWPAEKARFLVASAFSAGANNSDVQVQKFIAAAYELDKKSAKDACQRCAWDSDNHPLPKNVASSLALMTLALGKCIHNDLSSRLEGGAPRIFAAEHN